MVAWNTHTKDSVVIMVEPELPDNPTSVDFEVVIRQCAMLLACNANDDYCTNLARLIDFLAILLGTTHGEKYKELLRPLAYDIASHGI